MKAVVISSVGAESSYAGGPLGVYSNLICLSTFATEIINIAICKPHVVKQNDFKVHFINTDKSNSSTITEEVGLILEKFRPEVVWIHHYWVWKYFLDWAPKYPF